MISTLKKIHPCRAKWLLLMALWAWSATIYGITFKDASSACAQSLSPEIFPSHEGHVLTSSPFEGEVTLLGKGVGGGEVYRVSLQEGHNSAIANIIDDPMVTSVIVKDYFKAVSASNDLQAFELLSSLNSTSKWDMGVLEAVADPYNSQRIYLPPIQGQTLEDVFARDLLGGKNLSKVFATYAGFIQDLDKELSSLEDYTYDPVHFRPPRRSGGYGHVALGELKARIFKGRHDLHKVMALPQSEWPPSIVIWITPRNILVDSRSLQLVVIDPN